MANDTAERWTAVSGYEGYYEVSDLGRVRSLDRWIEQYQKGMHTRRRLRGRIRRLHVSPHGYLQVGLGIESRQNWKTCKVHLLVITAFRGPRPPGMECLHENGIKTDCRLSNLHWGTKSENALDLVRHGGNHLANRVRCPRNHLLAAPNLVASMAVKGFRTCLACGRARSLVRHAADRHGRSLDLSGLADEKYAEILTRAGEGFDDQWRPST